MKLIASAQRATIEGQILLIWPNGAPFNNCLRTQTVFNPKKLVCTCSGTGRPQCANTLESSVRTSSSSNLRTLPDPPPLAAEVASSPAYSSDGLKEPPAPPPDSFLYSDKAGRVANNVREETYTTFPSRSPSIFGLFLLLCEGKTS